MPRQKKKKLGYTIFDAAILKERNDLCTDYGIIKKKDLYTFKYKLNRTLRLLRTHEDKHPCVYSKIQCLYNYEIIKDANLSAGEIIDNLDIRAYLRRSLYYVIWDYFKDQDPSKVQIRSIISDGYVTCKFKTGTIKRIDFPMFLVSKNTQIMINGKLLEPGVLLKAYLEK